MKKIFVGATLILVLLMATSCSQTGLVDGYYTAICSDFDDYGWKEFVTICVNGGAIVSVEYNAENPSGMIKSWDMNYMRSMNQIAHTYPNFYTRSYAADLLKHQNTGSIDAVSGATHSYGLFGQLASAVLQLAQSGEEPFVVVDFS